MIKLKNPTPDPIPYCKQFKESGQPFPYLLPAGETVDGHSVLIDAKQKLTILKDNEAWLTFGKESGIEVEVAP